MTEEGNARESEHSVHVGVTPDLLALDPDLAFVMQAERRRASRMPMRNGTHALVAGGRFARASELLGGDHVTRRRVIAERRISRPHQEAASAPARCPSAQMQLAREREMRL